MTPEQQARLKIDDQLTRCGWLVQDHAGQDPAAAPGVAVREYPLTTGFADYLLFVQGRAAGVVEAKPEGHSLTGVEPQSAKYAVGLPPSLPAFRRPLPFTYETTGTATRFTNGLEPDARSREVFAFHRPEELNRLEKLKAQVAACLREMPPLKTQRLWPVQADAIRALEKSLAERRPRALIQMATGSGKTLTAVNVCDRLIKFAGARRILFLVDRNNLGRQTLNEFQQFVSPESGLKFTDEYTVTHLKGNRIPSTAKVVITTIQRLYSMLRGEADYPEENEEASLHEAEAALPQRPVEVAYNPDVPVEAFDFVIIDECHRSIYNVWRQVLDYFDASLIGLTATPTQQTLGFFQGNLVHEYTHEKAVADGVNVGFDVYRIETRVSRDGVALAATPGLFLPRRHRGTKAKVLRELDEDLTFAASQLDRDVVAPAQIRLVLSTFRDRLPEIFPGRKEVPKTLIFAKTDQHADDIVQEARLAFGKGNDFVVKITSKTTGEKPEDLLAKLRNSYLPRIAVTVDLVATGTDVKALECLVFMRNIRSLAYFEQMKGRGCRVIPESDLRRVTPDAAAKTHFVVVDAVGVCEAEKQATLPLDRKPAASLEELREAAATGAGDADLASALAARLSRLERRMTPAQSEAVAAAAGGLPASTLAACLLRAADPDEAEMAAGPGASDEQVEAAGRQLVRQALEPFKAEGLRRAIVAARSSQEQVLAEHVGDSLLRAEYDPQSRERAQSLVRSFREFIDEHREDIEALRVLYSRPFRAGLRFEQVKALTEAMKQSPQRLDPANLWQAYSVVEPAKVAGPGGRQLADVIALVRHALEPDGLLMPVERTVQQRYDDWLAEQAAAGRVFTDDQRRWLDAIKDHLAACLTVEADDLSDNMPFNQMGGLGRAHDLFGDGLAGLLQELNARLAA